MKHVHLIGIGGTGLSAIARLLLEKGYRVSGSDQTRSSLAVELEQVGAHIFTGHAAQNIAGADLVVRSSAIPDTNVEVLAALEAGIPMIKRADFLGQLMKGHLGIAVAGTHGKTTTTAMTAWVLNCLGQQPSYIIGGVSKNLGNNAHAGGGLPFVIEADEYDRMFLGLQPDLIILLNAEHDHPDCFPTPASYRAAFVDFIHCLRPGGTLVGGYDHPNSRGLLKEIQEGSQAVSFGLQPGADYHAENLRPNTLGGFSFDIHFHGEKLASVNLQVPGAHNASNALAVLAAAHELHLDVEAAALALQSFSGTGRRFDVLGDANGVTIINDYGHHPTEIRATLSAARSRYPERRIWAVWQPHTYSRTQTLLSEFATSFEDADEIIVTEIYASREKSEDFSTHDILPQMPARARTLPTLGAISADLIENLKPGDVLLVFSAGDADQISVAVFNTLQQQEDLA